MNNYYRSTIRNRKQSSLNTNDSSTPLFDDDDENFIQNWGKSQQRKQTSTDDIGFTNDNPSVRPNGEATVDDVRDLLVAKELAEGDKELESEEQLAEQRSQAEYWGNNPKTVSSAEKRVSVIRDQMYNRFFGKENWFYRDSSLTGGVRTDTRNIPMTASDFFWVGALTLILAPLTIAVAISLLHFIYGFLRPPCGVVNGSECNYPYGTCNEYGQCECDPRFSGEICEVTACPGYSDVDRTVCGGRGMCSPGLRYDSVIPECFWETPSRENGFNPQNNKGWGHPDCIARLAEIREQFEQDDITEYEIADIDGILSLPVCTCQMPFYGDECAATSNACPIAIDNQICSGNGNFSVTYPHNHTNTGNGCQCVEQFNFMDPVYRSKFSPEFIFFMNEGGNFASFSQPYCGKVIFADEDPDTFIVKVSPGPLGTSYQCFCDEDHFGVVCEFGKCPDVNDVICDGAGHESFGFGLEINTTKSSNRGRNCRPQCLISDVEGIEIPTTRCEIGLRENNCTAIPDAINPRFDDFGLCGVVEQCPPETPLRCSTGLCVGEVTDIVGGFGEGFDQTQNNCGEGYQYGWWDVPYFETNVRSRVRCDLTTQEGMEKCFNGQDFPDSRDQQGLRVDVSMLPLQVQFDVPLVWFSFAVKAKPRTSIHIRYRDHEDVIVGPDIFAVDDDRFKRGVGEFREMLEEVELKTYRTDPSYSLVSLTLDSAPNVFSLHPIPFLTTELELYPREFQQVRLYSLPLSQHIVFEAMNSRNRFTDLEEVVGDSISDYIESFTSLNELVPVHYVRLRDTTSVFPEDAYWKSIDATSVSLSNCVEDSQLCLWTWDVELHSMVDLVENYRACYDSNTNLFTPQPFSQPCSSQNFPDEVDSDTLPYSAFSIVTTELIAAARGNVINDLDTIQEVEWELQLIDPDPVYTVEIDFDFPSFDSEEGVNVTTEEHFIVLDELEWVTIDDLRKPCVCPPPALNNNQSFLNARWLGEIESRGVVSNRFLNVHDKVVAEIDVVGQPMIMRGIVQQAQDTTNATVMAIKGMETLQTVMTPNVSVISNTEFVQGMEDFRSQIFPLLCPTGTKGYAGHFEDPNEISTCRCDYALGTVLSESSNTNCTCVDTTSFTFTCDCVDNFVSTHDRLLTHVTNKTCSCSTSDKQFEYDLAARLDEIDDRCACFVDPYLPNLIRSEESNVTTSYIEFDARLDVNSDVSELFYPREIHFDWSEAPCPNLERVEAINYKFSDEFEDIDFEVYCRDDLNDDNFDEDSSFVLLQEHPAYTFDVFRFYFDMSGSATLLKSEMIWSPGGIPVSDVDMDMTLTASSNELSVNEVTNFNATHWSSKVDYTERPVFITYSFSRAHHITRVLLNLRTVGLPVLEHKNGSLAVELRVQASNLEFPYPYTNHDWTNLLFVVSNVYEGYDYILTDVNNTGPWRHIRLTSLYPISIREFVPFTDQSCECSDGVLHQGYASQIPKMDNDTDDLDPLLGEQAYITLTTNPDTLDTLNTTTNNIYSIVKDRLERLDVNDEECSCEDVGILRRNTFDLNSTFSVANDGVCSEEAFVGEQLGILPDRIQELLYVIEAYEHLQGLFGSNATESTSMAKEFPYSNDTYPTISKVLVYYSTILSPNGEPDESILPVIDDAFYAWEVNGTQTLESEGYVFYFATSTYELVWNLGNQFANANPNVSEIFNPSENYRLDVFEDALRYGDLINNGQAVYSGQDCGDCGPTSCFVEGTCEGLVCSISEREQMFLDDIQDRENRTTNEYRLVNEFRESGVGVNISGIRIQRASLNLTLEGCDGQVCTGYKSFRCEDGSCVSNPSKCTPRYDCPGNGCVQFSVNELHYQCVCKEGFDGIACNSDEAVPATVRDTRASNPFLWNHCGWPPGLKIQPPAPLLKSQEPITSEEYDRENRKFTPPINVADVRDERICPTDATGIPYLRTVTLPGGEVIETDCPYAHAGPFGQYLLLSDDVQVRNADGVVIQWTSYPTNVEGETIQYIWTSATTYDDFPYRCPSGACVADEPDCEALSLLFPTCNGHGRCRPDGTCKCDSGYKTFIFTEEFTRAKSVTTLLDLSTDSTNPTQFCYPNTNWRDYSTHWCKARDCSVQDCSPPKGCLPGSPSLNFEDRGVLCSDASGFGGHCGATDSACVRGEVTPTVICSGKGIVRIRAYTDPIEYYCECGTESSRTAVITDVRQTTELFPNGFGGDVCDVYECSEGLGSLHFSTIDPETGGPYFDETGIALPGIWRGYCDNPIGPDPDDINEWLVCNPGLVRLERAEFTPCVIQGRTECLESGTCIDNGGSPLVYPCNNHGTARKDGTCECVADELTGVGFTFDDERFSYDGCFKRISCGRSLINNRPCQFISACDEPEEWRDVPKIPYWEQQILTAVARMGFEISNQTVVRQITNLNDIEKLKESGYHIIAQGVEDDLAGITGCICVYPNDDPSNPIGMLMYDPNGPVAPYLKSFQSSYGIAISTPGQLENIDGISAIDAHRILFDDVLSTATVIKSSNFGQWGNPQQSRNEDYVLFRWRSWEGGKLDPPTSENSIRIDNFDNNEAYTLEVVRIHVISRFSPSKVRVTNQDDELVCSLNNGIDADIQAADYESALNPWRWVEVYCTPSYNNYQFQLIHPLEYQTNCRIPEQERCFFWKKETCEFQGAVFNPPGSFITYRGCDDVCCVLADGFVVEPVTGLNIKFYGFDPDGGGVQADVYVNEVRIMGYTNEVLPTPSGLRDEMMYLAGPTQATQECSDIRFFEDLFGPDKTIYHPDEDGGRSLQIKRTWEEAKLRCEDGGSKLAMTREFAGDNTFRFLADRCGEGNTGGQECWVNARNRYEVKNPEIRTFFKSVCQEHGCYFRLPRAEEYDSTDWASEEFRYSSFYMSRYNFNPSRARYMRTWQDVQFSMETHRRYLPDTPIVSDSSKLSHRTNSWPTYRKTGGPFSWEFWTQRDYCVVILYQEQSCTGPRYILGLNNDGVAFDGSANWRQNQHDYGGGRYNSWRFPTEFAANPLYPVTGPPYIVTNPGQLVKDGLSSVALFGSCHLRLGKFTSFEENQNWWDRSFRTYRDSDGVVQARYNYRDNRYNTFVSFPDEQEISRINYPIAGGTVDENTISSGICFENKWFGANRESIELFPHDYNSRIWIYPNYNAAKIRVTYGGRRRYYSGPRNPEPDQEPEYPAEVMGWFDQEHMCMHTKIEQVDYIGDGNPAGGSGVPYNSDRLCGADRFYGCKQSLIGRASNVYRLLNNAETPMIFYDDPRTYQNSIPQPSRGSEYNTGNYILDSIEYCTSNFALVGNLNTECQTCMQELDHDWKWDQETFPTSTTGFQFAYDVNEFQDIEAPKIHVRWFDRQGGTYMQPLEDMALLENSDMWSGFVKQSTSNLVGNGDYNRNFFLNNCLTVSPDRSIHARICSETRHFVCIRDYLKYAVQAGRQCDWCGTSAAIGGDPRVNTTCFDEFPKAKEEDFPFDWAVYRARLAGTLNLLARYVAYDYDAARQFLDEDDSSLIFAIGLIVRYFQLDFSDRPGRQTLGVQPNHVDWLDLSLTNAFPYDCGSQCSQEDGKCGRYCASRREYCDPDSQQLEPVDMVESEMPTIFNAVPNEDLAKEDSTCGTNVNPVLYNRKEVFGHAQPGLRGQFEQLAIKNDDTTIRLRAFTSNPEWYNVGKNAHYYVFDHNVTTYMYVSASLECVTCGPVTLNMYITPINVRYLYDEVPKFYVGSLPLTSNDGVLDTVLEVDLTEEDVGLVEGNNFPNVTYQTVVWSFDGLDKAGVVEINSVILTDDTKIQKCLVDRGERPWKEHSSLIKSTAPENVCLLNEEQRRFYGAGIPGTCLCAPMFGGEFCDYPASLTPNGKQVCAGQGAHGGLVIPPSRTVQEHPQVRLNEPFGEGGGYVYVDDNGQIAAACKSRDPGIVIRTTLSKESPHDYPKVTRFDTRPGDALYIKLEDLDDDDFPATKIETDEFCLAESASLPSWISGGEAVDYYDLETWPVFVDMAQNDLVDDGNVDWNWDDRNVQFVACADEASCGEVFAQDCNTDEYTRGICDSMNFNNVVYELFEAETYSELTDGDAMLPGSFLPGLTELDVDFTTRDGEIFINPDDLFAYIWVWTDNLQSNPLELTGCTRINGFGTGNAFQKYRYEYNCNGVTMATLERGGIDLGTTLIREIQVLTGATRTPFYDYTGIYA
ncbi:MAG: hypothetical protein ACTSUE_09150 [Promethearchaeota archaeon]